MSVSLKRYEFLRLLYLNAISSRYAPARSVLDVPESHLARGAPFGDFELSYFNADADCHIFSNCFMI